MIYVSNNNVIYLFSAKWTISSVFKPLPNTVKMVKMFAWFDKTNKYFFNVFCKRKLIKFDLIRVMHGDANIFQSR